MTVLGPGSRARTDVDFLRLLCSGRRRGLGRRPIRQVELTSRITPTTISILQQRPTRRVHGRRPERGRADRRRRGSPSEEEEEPGERVGGQALAQREHAGEDAGDDGGHGGAGGHHDGPPVLQPSGLQGGGAELRRLQGTRKKDCGRAPPLISGGEAPGRRNRWRCRLC